MLMPAVSTSLHPLNGEPCIALIDARFLSWLHGAGDDSEAEPGRPAAEPAGRLRDRLPDVLAGVLLAARLPARITRLMWYTSHVGAASLAGQVVRQVPAETADGGVGLVLAMARDALQLAEQRACLHLLIASDDDRLLPTVDAVQARGLRVHLLADESAADLLALEKTEGAWASLLRQADTRLIVEDLERPPVRSPRRERSLSSPVDVRGYTTPTADGLQAIPPLVNGWLASLNEATRSLLQGQLPEQRGLPQEADRELLQQISHHLGRPLSVPERKLMRELAREALAFQGLGSHEPG